MKIKPFKTFYRSRLPHIHPIGSIFFITFRLKDSLPKSVINKLREERNQLIESHQNSNHPDKYIHIYHERKRYFAKFDKLLENESQSPMWLSKPSIASIVAAKMHELAAKGWYDLIAYCIMSNHIHLVIDMSKQLEEISSLVLINHKNYIQVERILKNLKGSTARFANLKLERTGNSFWAKDSYDHYIRNEQEFKNVVNYTLANPVKAGLVKSWKDWRFSYFNEDYWQPNYAK